MSVQPRRETELALDLIILAVHDHAPGGSALGQTLGQEDSLVLGHARDVGPVEPFPNDLPGVI
jgi:hypothetical protein